MGQFYRWRSGARSSLWHTIVTLAAALLYTLTVVNEGQAQAGGTWRVVDSIEFMIPTRHWYSVDCADDLHCIAAGKEYDRRSYDLVKATTDGGETWREVLRETLVSVAEPRIRDVSYPSRNLIIAVGDSGIIIRSTNGGTTWSRQFLTGVNLEHIDMANDRVGSIVGPRLLGTLRTVDGGATWNYLRFEDTLAIPHEVQTPTDSTVILNTIKSKQGWTIQRSSDGGRSFESLGQPSHRSNSLYYRNADIGWSFGSRQYGQSFEQSSDVVELTTDGGQTWRVMLDTIVTSLGGLTSGSFADSANGFAVGYERTIWRTTDVGKTWTRTPNNFEAPVFSDVSFPSLARAIATCTTRGQIMQFTSENAIVPDDRLQRIYDIRVTGNDQIMSIDSRNDPIVSVRLYDMRGNNVATVLGEGRTYSLSIDARNLTTGAYCVQVELPKGTWQSVVVLNNGQASMSPVRSDEFGQP